jgi:hypothetical protein
MALLDDINEILNNWKQANPQACHGLGIHDYDGQVKILTEEWIKSRVQEISDDLKKIGSLRSKYEDNKFEKFELNLVRMALEKELFELRDRQEYRENPLTFIGPLTIIEGSYTKRSFATVEDRIDSIINPHYKKLFC